jgi:hypothetical protein
MSDLGDRIPAELAPVEDRLRAARVHAGALELDELKLRARRQATHAAPAYRKGTTFMKSRLALTLMIVFGLMMSGTGATLALDSVGNDDSAASGVYPDQEERGQDDDTLAGEDVPSEDVPDGEVVGTEDVQPTSQVAAGESGGSLPFTGFLAIPLLLGGVALLGTGAVVRLRTRHEHDE